jgi:hypothetical protein
MLLLDLELLDVMEHLTAVPDDVPSVPVPVKHLRVKFLLIY